MIGSATRTRVCHTHAHTHSTLACTLSSPPFLPPQVDCTVATLGPMAGTVQVCMHAKHTQARTRRHAHARTRGRAHTRWRVSVRPDRQAKPRVAIKDLSRSPDPFRTLHRTTQCEVARPHPLACVTTSVCVCVFVSLCVFVALWHAGRGAAVRRPRGSGAALARPAARPAVGWGNP